MSLESYRRAIEAQQERERRYSVLPHHSRHESVEDDEYVAPKSKKPGTGKLILVLVIIAVLLLAALKNPSQSEAKAEIKTIMMEKVNEKMRKEVTNEDNDALKQFGSGIAMLLAPKLIDIMVQTDVSDYVFFSTFDANVTVDEEKKTVVAGIIVFGKIIPLKTDIKEEFLNK